MKIAITGKGGVGKSTLAAALARLFASEGRRVFAIDADPDANLAFMLGVPAEKAAQLRPLSEMKELVEERTGVKPGAYGAYFRLNPQVEDIPERFSLDAGGVKLLVLGGMKKAGSGCYCPENTLLKALVANVVTREEVVILDMEAGIEHLSRGAVKDVDALIIVSEPSRASLSSVERIAAMAGELGVKNVFVVGNKVRGDTERAFIRSGLPGMNIAGFIPYLQSIAEAEKLGKESGAELREVTASIRDCLAAALGS